MANKYLKSIDVIYYTSNKTKVTIIFKVDIPVNYGIIASDPGKPNHAGGIFSGNAIVPYQITGEGQIASNILCNHTIQLDMELASDWGTEHITGITISYVGDDDQDSMATTNGRQGFKPSGE